MIKFINNLSPITDDEKFTELNEKLMEDLEAKTEFVCYSHYCENYS